MSYSGLDKINILYARSLLSEIKLFVPTNTVGTNINSFDFIDNLFDLQDIQNVVDLYQNNTIYSGEAPNLRDIKISSINDATPNIKDIF